MKRSAALAQDSDFSEARIAPATFQSFALNRRATSLLNPLEAPFIRAAFPAPNPFLLLTKFVYLSIIDKWTNFVNNKKMNVTKKDKVLTSALDVFLRYGYKRVTMNDLAEAASISRPALYLIFESKEEIFKSVYEHWVHKTLIEIENKLAQLEMPEEKLRAAFELWTVRSFEMMQSSSEVAELVECTFGFAQDSVNQGYRSFEKILLPILKSHSKFQSGKTRVSAEKTARILSAAVRGFKVVAKDASQIRSLINELLILLLDG